MSRSRKLRVTIAVGLLIALSVGYAKLEAARTQPQSVAENVRIIDGDRLELNGQRIHLIGIDAPELEQLCGAADAEYPCGQESKAALEALLVGVDNIVCEKKDADSDGWVRAVCKANGLDVNAEMVRSGQALAYRDEAFLYSNEEGEAQKFGAGLWASEFQPPWEWRAAQ